MLRLSGRECDRLCFERLGIEQDQRTRLFKSRHGNEPDLLASGSFDDIRGEVRLIANEEDMRALSNDERIAVLKRIAPCQCISS